MTDLTCDLGRKESKRWRNVNPKIIIILTVGIYRTHLNIYYQHQNYDILLLVPICQQHIMTGISLPICHRMKFYSRFIIVRFNMKNNSNDERQEFHVPTSWYHRRYISLLFVTTLFVSAVLAIRVLPDISIGDGREPRTTASDRACTMLSL